MYPVTDTFELRTGLRSLNGLLNSIYVRVMVVVVVVEGPDE